MVSRLSHPFSFSGPYKKQPTRSDELSFGRRLKIVVQKRVYPFVRFRTQLYFQNRSITHGRSKLKDVTAIEDTYTAPAVMDETDNPLTSLNEILEDIGRQGEDGKPGLDRDQADCVARHRTDSASQRYKQKAHMYLQNRLGSLGHRHKDRLFFGVRAFGLFLGRQEMKRDDDQHPDDHDQAQDIPPVKMISFRFSSF